MVNIEVVVPRFDEYGVVSLMFRAMLVAAILQSPEYAYAVALKLIRMSRITSKSSFATHRKADLCGLQLIGQLRSVERVAQFALTPTLATAGGQDRLLEACCASFAQNLYSFSVCPKN